MLRRGMMAQAAAGGGGSYADDYATIFAAWSAEKVVIRGYSGSLIRICRSSDNTEQDIGSVGGVLDTASISSFVGSNSAYVTKVYKQTGATVTDLAQATAANQPRIVNAGTLETNYAQCDGSNDSMGATITGGLNVSVATVFFRGLVGTTNSNGQYGGAVDIGYNTTSKVGLAIYSEGRTLTGTPGVVFGMSGGSSGPYMQRGFKDADRSSRSAARIFTSRYDLSVSATDDTALRAYQDGSDASQTTPATGNPNGTFNQTAVSIGMLASGAHYNNTGFRTLILVASDALSQRANIEAVM